MPPSRSRLPPLPMKVLKAIDGPESFARKSLGQCAAMIPMPDRTSVMYDFPRALRVLRTCAGEVFEIQAEYYVTQPGWCEYWIDLIESNVRQGLNSLALVSGFPEAHKDMLDLHLQTEVLIDKVEEWKSKLRDSVKSSQRPTIVRCGYRAEIKAWMKANGIRSQARAAKRLNVSIDVLKSVMSSKGSLRCSAETQKEILKKIGHDQP
jgi:hypothetical protein